MWKNTDFISGPQKLVRLGPEYVKLEEFRYYFKICANFTKSTTGEWVRSSEPIREPRGPHLLVRCT